MATETSKLHTLDLSHNLDIQKGHLECFSDSLGCCSLRVLKLAGVGVTDQCAQALGKGLSQCSLTELDLQRNHMGMQGTMSIVNNMPCGLKKLNLDMNTLDTREMTEVKKEVGSLGQQTHLVLETRWYNPDDPHARF